MNSSVYFVDKFESSGQMQFNGGVLNQGAKIYSTYLSRPFSIGLFSAINRCYFGKYSTIGSFSYVVDSKINNYCSIGSRVSIGGFSHPIDEFSSNEISFRNTSTFFGETLINEDSDYYKKQKTIKTELGPDCYIGDNAVILRGVILPVGCVVGAGAVVIKKTYQPYSIIVGNPGVVKRKRFDEQAIENMLKTKWWELDLSEIIKVMPDLVKITGTNSF